MRGLRPSLTDQISTYGSLAEGRVEILDEISHRPDRRARHSPALPTLAVLPTPAAQATTPDPTPVISTTPAAPVPTPNSTPIISTTPAAQAPTPASTSIVSSTPEAQATTPNSTPVIPITSDSSNPTQTPTPIDSNTPDANFHTAHGRPTTPVYTPQATPGIFPTHASPISTPTPAPVVVHALDAETLAPALASVTAPAAHQGAPYLDNPPIDTPFANAAHVQQVTVVVHTTPHSSPEQQFANPAQHPHEDPDPHSEHAHSPSPSDDSSQLSTDEEAVEQLIRDAVCGAASAGASHEAIETATLAAVKKRRQIRSKHKGRSPHGKKRSYAATTGHRAPESAPAQSETLPPTREVDTA